MPKASAPEFHQSNRPRLVNASWCSGRTHGFCVTGGHSPIASEPTPSPRLWATAQARPRTAVPTYHEGLKQTLKTGTFYLAGNRNFLFGSDTSRDRERALECNPVIYVTLP